MENSPTEAATELLIADFWRVVADAEALLKATANQGGDEIAELRSRAEASLLRIKQRLNGAQAALRVTGQQAITATDAFIQENPWSAVGVAAGLGLLIGVLSGRR